MDIDRIAKSVWRHAKNLAIVPVVLLVALYSAFGIVFIAVPAKFVATPVRASRRLLRRFSRWFQSAFS